MKRFLNLSIDLTNSATVANRLDIKAIYIERMLKISLMKGAKVKICGSCSEARGLKGVPLIEGAEISTMAELTEWVVSSDKVLVF
jgi:uncharacterized protein involved in oxidation of intracellular sulfur